MSDATPWSNPSLYRKIKNLEAENACLKAEVERLDTLCKQLMAQHSDISCENIMLRNAGDALAAWTLTLEHTYDHKPMDGLPFSSFLCVWHEAAKEGKQS